MKTTRLFIDPADLQSATVEFYDGPVMFATMDYAIVTIYDYVSLCEDMANWTCGAVDQIGFI